MNLPVALEAGRPLSLLLLLPFLLLLLPFLLLLLSLPPR
jgi:hypothetical protein